MKKWYDIRVPGVGSICIKADYASKALAEAEERMGATQEQMKKASCVMVGAYMRPEAQKKAAPRSEPSEGGKGDNV